MRSISICDCPGAVKSGTKIKQGKSTRYAVNAEHDICPYCGHYVYNHLLDAPKRSIRDGKVAHKRFSKSDNVYLPKQPLILDIPATTVGVKAKS